jgi:Flp pilus assembly pilin Flp
MRSPPLSLGRIRAKTGVGQAALRLIGDTRGVTMIEYALIAGLIAIAAAVLIGQIGGFVSTTFSTVAGDL